jgi:hypothetical protein
MLSGAVTAGVLTSVAGLTGILGLASPTMADDRDRRRDDRRDEQRGERHYPKIHASLEALRAARAELLAAGDDFHGHKDTALRAVDDAIRQLEMLVAERP